MLTSERNKDDKYAKLASGMTLAGANESKRKKPTISFQDVEDAEAEVLNKAGKSRIGVSASSRLYANPE